MPQLIICISNQPESASIYKNFHKLSNSLQFERLLLCSVVDLMPVVLNHPHTSHVWLDVECVHSPDTVKHVQDIDQMIRTMCALRGSRPPGLVITVDHNCDITLLKALCELNLLGVVVRSDLKLKRIALDAISNFITGTPHISPSVIKMLMHQPALFARADQPKTNITYLIPRTPKTVSQQCLLGLCEDLRITVDRCEHWQQMISKLQMPNYQTHAVIIDLSVLTSHEDLSVMDMISCVHTVRRTRIKQSPFRVYVAVAMDDDPALVRKVLKIPQVAGVFPILTQGFDVDDVRLAVKCLQQSQPHLPQRVQQMLNSHKTHTQPKSQPLTHRQTEILTLITDHAASNKVIAHRLKISEGSVKTHVGHLLRKFGLRSRTELAVYKQV